MTYTVCTECGREIPWGQPRVYVRFMEGFEVIKEGEVCVRWCATQIFNDGNLH